VNSAIFREYDIRGIADTDLTDGVIRSIGRAFGERLREQGKARVAVAGTSALLAAHPGGPRGGTPRPGRQVIDVGEVPTRPSISRCFG